MHTNWCIQIGGGKEEKPTYCLVHLCNKSLGEKRGLKPYIERWIHTAVVKPVLCYVILNIIPLEQFLEGLPCKNAARLLIYLSNSKRYFKNNKQREISDNKILRMRFNELWSS